jgi:plastocyanin
MAIQKQSPNVDYNAIRYMVVGALVVAAFFGAYKFAQAGSAQAGSTAPATTQAAAQGGAAGSTDSAAGGGSCCGGGSGAAAGGASAGAAAGSAAAASGGCCGGGANAAPVTGAAKVSGGVQKISVDLSSGSYNPNVIQLKAGVPAEITFGQGSSCAAVIQSSDLNFQVDTSAGAKTVKLQALKPGTYNFACSMNMVQGQIVVQ